MPVQSILYCTCMNYITYIRYIRTYVDLHDYLAPCPHYQYLTYVYVYVHSKPLCTYIVVCYVYCHRVGKLLTHCGLLRGFTLLLCSVCLYVPMYVLILVYCG